MKISIKTHPKSKKTQVLENEALIKALSEHLGVARSRLNISSGHSSRNKIVEVELGDYFGNLPLKRNCQNSILDIPVWAIIESNNHPE